MFGAIGFLVLALIFWFGMAREATDESATGFVRFFKAIFGVKGYVIVVKIFAVIFFLSSLNAFYEYFFE